MPDKALLDPGVSAHQEDPGMLQLSPDVLEQLLSDEPIESHLTVEPRPFARWAHGREGIDTQLYLGLALLKVH